MQANDVNDGDLDMKLHRVAWKNQQAIPDNKGTPHYTEKHFDKALQDSNEMGYVSPPWQMVFQTVTLIYILPTIILEVGAISQVYFQLSHLGMLENIMSTDPDIIISSNNCVLSDTTQLYNH